MIAPCSSTGIMISLPMEASIIIMLLLSSTLLITAPVSQVRYKLASGKYCYRRLTSKCFVKICMGHFILGAPTFRGIVQTLNFGTHAYTGILVCAFFITLFVSKDICLCLSVPTNQNLAFINKF